MNLAFTADEEARLAARAQAQGTTPEDLVRQAIDPVIGAAGEPTGPQSPEADGDRPNWHVIADNMKGAPPEELARLPKDGASEHDHYIYGWPKRHE